MYHHLLILKKEFMKAGGSYAIVFKNYRVLHETLDINLESAYAPSKEVSHKDQGLTAVEKIFNAAPLLELSKILFFMLFRC